MVPASHGLLSTNWNSGEPASKRHTRISEIAKVINVVHIATQRALRATEGSSPRIAMMNSAPSSGRNTVTERIGQLAMSVSPAAKHEPALAAKHEPGDESRNADQHGERIMIHIAGLQAHDVAGDVKDPRRDAVGTEAVDQPAVAALPQQATKPQRRTYDDGVVDLVEVPLVEEEPVEHAMLLGELDGKIWTTDIEQPRHPPTDQHQHARQQRDDQADMLHFLQDRVGTADRQRLAEKAFYAGACEDAQERKSGKHAPERQHEQGTRQVG